MWSVNGEALLGQNVAAAFIIIHTAEQVHQYEHWDGVRNGDVVRVGIDVRISYLHFHLNFKTKNIYFV